MWFAGKIVLVILGISLTVILCTIIAVIVSGMITGAAATGLPALWRDPFYWLFMILIVGGEIWLAVNKNELVGRGLASTPPKIPSGSQ